MHILYAVTTCSDRVYKELFSRVKVKPAFQSQKYHRLLIEGLAAHTKVDVIANAPVNRSNLEKAFVRLPEETEGGARYHYIPAIRNPVLKLMAVASGTFFKTLFMAKKDTAVIVDCLNRTTAFFALLAARLRRKRCIGIITDLPDMLGGGGFSKKMANFVIRHCTGYVLLTEAMNDYLNKKGKPYVILEGHSDITMEDKIPSMDKKTAPRVVFYAGGVSRQYGLANLVDGFRMAAPENARLHIYGPGDYVKELQTIAEKDKIISDLQKELESIRRHEQALNNVWKENLRENREYWDEYAAEQFKNGIEFGIKEERKRRNAGRKKRPDLEADYLTTATEVQKLLDMGHSMKDIIENGMITRVNPRTKQIEPVSKSTIYRCMRAYKSSTK